MTKLVTLFVLLIGISAQASTLLPGDSSFETGLSWLVAGSLSGNVRWAQDITTAVAGDSSLKITFPQKNFVHSRLFHLPAGEYTFSFWAKTDVKNISGWIGIWKPWSQNFIKPIKLTSTWKRYNASGMLKKGGAWLCIGANAPGTIWVDGFQLEHGKVASAYEQAHVLMGMECGNEAEDRVFYAGTSIPLKVKAQQVQQQIVLQIEDAWKKAVYTKTFTPQDNRVAENINIPSLPPGIYHCWLQSVETKIKNYLSFAIVNAPLKQEEVLNPFLGLDGAGLLRTGIERAGARIVEVPIRWQHIETSPGNYNWGSLKTIQALYEKGYVIKAFFSGIPSWAWDSQEKKDAHHKETGTGHNGLLPSTKGLQSWKEFVTTVTKKYGKHVTYFEIGAEDDLIWGRNPYYRNKYSEHIEKSFVVGPLAKRVAAFYDLAVEAVRINAPHAKIGLLRPSGSDCTSFDYTFSEAVFAELTTDFDYFPIDPYIVPRYLGTGMPKVSEVDGYLKDDLDRAVAMLKRLGKNTDLAISELGFAVSIADPIDSNYYLESAKRMVRSILIAKAHPHVKFVQWYVLQAGTEGDKVQYNLWKSDNPTVLVPAFSAVAHLVENVKTIEELPLSDVLRSIIYEKKDGKVSLAIWAQKENGSIAFDQSIKDLKITSFLGKVLSAQKGLGKNIYPVTDFPLYIHADSREILEKNLANASLLFPPLQGSISIEHINIATIKIKNRLQKAVVVTGSISLDKKTKTLHPFTLTAGKEHILQVPLAGSSKVSVKVDANIGDLYEPLTLQVDETFTPIKARIQPFVIDGNLNDWAAYKPASKFRGRGDIAPPDPAIDWDGDRDLSSDILLAWDPKHLYIAAIVHDDKHFNTHEGGRIWAGDSVQIAIDAKSDAATATMPGYDDNDMELGLALTKEKGKQFHIWHGTQNARTTKCISAVTRDEANTKTVYEMAIPWDELDGPVVLGKVLGINYVIQDDDDGKGSTYCNQLTLGITGSKDPKLFNKFYLTK